MTQQTIFQKQIMECTRCPDMCACCCPVFAVEKKQSLTPSNKAHAAQMLSAGLVNPEQAYIEAVYQCSNCRLCAEWCIYDDLVLGDLLIEARRWIVSRNPELLPERVRQVAETYQTAGVVHPLEVSEEKDQLRRLCQKSASQSGNILFFEGNLARSTQPEITLAGLKLLELAGVELVYLPEEEPACGAVLHLLGFDQLAQEAAQKTRDFLQVSGVNLVLTPSPQMAYHLTVGFQRLGLKQDIPVMTTVEYLAGLIANGQLPVLKGNPGRIVLDDDPYLSRFLDLADLARQLILANPDWELIEAQNQGKMAPPGVSYSPLPSRETENEITRRRLEQLMDGGAGILVTTSPRAKMEYAPHLPQTIKILDLMELILETVF